MRMNQEELRRKADELRKQADRQLLISRMNLDPNVRLREYFPIMKERFENTGKHRVYIIELKPEIRGVIPPCFPNTDDFPVVPRPILGCVYIGLTGNSYIHRFNEHISGYNACKPAKKGYFNSNSFDECGEKLTQLYGFDNVRWEDTEYLESWVGWALYKCGYWVWGPHKHLQTDVIGVDPYI